MRSGSNTAKPAISANRRLTLCEAAKALRLSGSRGGVFRRRGESGGRRFPGKTGAEGSHPRVRGRMLLLWPAATQCIDHIVPQVRMGRNGCRNLVSSCSECNSRKGERRAEDFLRWRYRARRLESGELKERLRALEKIASGKMRPEGERADDARRNCSTRIGIGRKKEPGHSAEGPRDPGLSCPPPQ